MAFYLLDTNILIDLVGAKRSRPFFDRLLKGPSFRLGTSILCLAEFFAGASRREAKILEGWIESRELEVVYLDTLDQAIRAGELRKKLALAMPDALIVASAISAKGHLVTQDTFLLKKAREYVEIYNPSVD